MFKFGQNKKPLFLSLFGNARIGLRQFETTAIPLLIYHIQSILVNKQIVDNLITQKYGERQ